MKRIYIRRKPYAVDDEVMDEFKTLRSRQSRLWRRIRMLEDALGNAIPFIEDGEFCGKVKSMLEEGDR